MIYRGKLIPRCLSLKKSYFKFLKSLFLNMKFLCAFKEPKIIENTFFFSLIQNMAFFPRKFCDLFKIYLEMRMDPNTFIWVKLINVLGHKIKK